jgi:hypothetical protein
VPPRDSDHNEDNGHPEAKKKKAQKGTELRKILISED